MKLHVLIRSLEDASPRLTYQLLQKACHDQAVELVPIEQEKMSFGADSRHIISDGDAFYRLSTGPAQILAEQLLVRPQLSTIYEPWRLPLLSSSWQDTLLMLDKGLPIVETVFLFSPLSEEEIEGAVSKLGGYPVVAKYTGLSHGQGVFKCEEYDDIKSLIARYPKNKYAQLALRRFIADAVHLRVVVVGDQAVDTIKYDQPAGDFRTNAVEVPTATSFQASTEVEQLALAAAVANGVKLAGVDILLDKNHHPWVAELNTPCNFGRNYLTNQKNIAQNLLKLLTA